MNETSRGEVGGEELQNIYKVLVQCFALVSSGYASMRLGIVNEDSMGGVRALLLYLLTPAIIVHSLLGLSFANLSWLFLALIFAAKAAVFCVSAGVTLLLSDDFRKAGYLLTPAIIVLSLLGLSSANLSWLFLALIFAAKAAVFCVSAGVTLLLSDDFRKAGIYGIFTTQANDFALGVPLLTGVYGAKEGAAMLQYIYLGVPISLAILNPIGFALMEMGARKEEKSNRPLCYSVFKSVAENPVCIATFLGLIGNRIGAVVGIPGTLTVVLEGFSSAFVAVALFALGTTFHRNGKMIEGAFLPVTPVALVLAKGLLLPLLIRFLCRQLLPPDEAARMGFLGFLMGSLPTAPTVFVYASYYRVAVHQVSTGIALGTLVAGPWLYLTTHMSGFWSLDAATVRTVLHAARLNTALISAVFGMLTVVVLVIKRRHNAVPHQFTIGLLLSSVVLGAGEEWWWIGVCGWFGQWLWAAVLPVSLYLYRAHSLCALLRYRIPILLSVTCTQIGATLLHYFLPAAEQAVLRAGVLLSCSIVAVAFLIAQQRMSRAFLPVMEPVITDIEECHQSGSSDEDGDLLPTRRGRLESEDAEMFLCPKSNADCSQRRRTACKRAVALYAKRVGHPEKAEEPEDLGPHIMLTSSACVAMILHMFVLGGEIIEHRKESGGLLSQLEMLDVFFTFGLGSTAFLLFGMEPELLVSVCRRRWRRLQGGSEKLALPAADELDAVTRAICRTFVRHHLQDCLVATAENIREGLEVHPRAVRGSELVSWLEARGLASDRGSGTKYGMRLVLGRVLRHVRDEEHFADSHHTLFVFPADQPHLEEEEETTAI